MSTAHEDKLAVEFHLLKESTESPFKEHFPNYVDGLYKGEPGGYLLQPGYTENAEKIYNYPPRSDDVWVVTFPKCGKSLQTELLSDNIGTTFFSHRKCHGKRLGTTWSLEMMWLMKNGLDFEGAKAATLSSRTAFLE